jgi:tripartite-type tricarboxylate transporter receptor subunit TctC
MSMTEPGDTKQNPFGGRLIGRRAFQLLAACAAATALTAKRAQAADYPVRPVRIIVPFVPGGATDLVARKLATKLADLLHQNFLVENHGGGDTIIGTSLVAQARPDGYTVLLASNTFALNPTLRPKSLPYDTLKDFTPVTIAAIHPFVLVVNPSVPAKTLEQFIALAKSEPGKLNFASAGVGTGNHLATELLLIKAGIKITHVPYQGTGAFIPDLLAGRVQMTLGPVSLLAPYVRTGALRALGVGEKQRLAVLPDVPTISEAGVPGYAANEWNGFVVRSGTPTGIVNTLNTALGEAVKEPDVVNALSASGAYPMHDTPAEAKQFIAEEIAKWRDVITKADIRLKDSG